MILAYTKDFTTQPIALALERRGWKTVPTLHPCDLLNSGEADIVIAPPIEYARCLGVYDHALVPGLAIMTSGFAGLVVLAFNKGLQNLDTVAVKQLRSSETIAAGMILSEKYDIAPQPVEASEVMGTEQMLKISDAALLVGDDAIFGAPGVRSSLDMTDEWEDVTGTPFPYMLAWGRVGEISHEVIIELLSAREEAVLMLADLASLHPNSVAAHAFYQRYLQGAIRYSFEESDVAALESFYRMAFYYSMISDIPAIKYLPDGEPAPSTPM